MSKFIVGGDVSLFDQLHSELIMALRRERRGFFVMIAPENPIYGFYVAGEVEEMKRFLKDVIASAECELEKINQRIA